MSIKQYIAAKWDSDLSSVWEEIKYLIYGLFAFLQIDIDVVFILGILMMIDTGLGIAKSVIVSKLKFTFAKLLWGLVSKAGILLIPMILALVAKGVGFDFKWLVEIVLKILVVSEAISGITNILSIKEKKHIKNEDFISKLLHAVRQFFSDTLRKIIQNIK